MIQNNNLSERQEWMAVLAKANWTKLEDLFSELPNRGKVEVLRKPETGLVMVRGKMGGKGASFNTGEATVTRCSVKSEAGFTGHSYILGRNHKHARIAAEMDALLQEEASQNYLLENVIAPLKAMQQTQVETERRKSAATKVDFFTLVRGEDD